MSDHFTFDLEALHKEMVYFLIFTHTLGAEWAEIFMASLVPHKILY